MEKDGSKMAVQGSYSKPKEPLGQFILKILFFLFLIIIGAIALFGFVLQAFDPIAAIQNVVIIAFMVMLLILAGKGIAAFFEPKPFSPTDDFRTDVVRFAKKAKPRTVKDLYLRGEDMRMPAKLGKIIGLHFLPYQTSRPIRDNNGKPVFEKNEIGELQYDNEWSKPQQAFIQVPRKKHEMITEKDGDTLFVINKNGFPLSLINPGVDIIRSHKKYHSDLVGDVYIKAVSIVPYGEWGYPNQQWQGDISKILKEHEAETIITTHRNNLDLVSNVTQMSLGADPTFQKIMMAQSERLSGSNGFNSQGGNP